MKRVCMALFAALLVVVVAAEGAGAASPVSARLSASTTKVGSTVYVDGSVGDDAEQVVVLQRFVDGGWSDRDRALTDADGAFRLPVKPSSAGTYRLRVRLLDDDVVSDELRLNVVPARVTMSINLSAASVRRGTRVDVRGVITPKGATRSVVLQRKVDGRWGDRGTGIVDATNGNYRVSFRPSQTGTYVLRVRSGGGSVWTRTVTLSVTAPPPVQPPPTTPPPPTPPACHPSYRGACVPPNVSDVDCAGGSGDGPYYVSGPITVVGPDVYRLDSDHDGIACENG